MKKGLTASFMVALMLVTVSAVVTANAVTFNNVTGIDETTDYVTIHVLACDFQYYEFWPLTWNPIGYVKMTLTSEDGTINIVKYTGLFDIFFSDGCFFRHIPADKNYTISAYKPKWDVIKIVWEEKYFAVIWMEKTGVNSRNLENPFIFERFPSLSSLLQRLEL